MLYTINNRNRRNAGNICLIVLLALFLSMVTGAFAPAPAEASMGGNIGVTTATAFTNTLTAITGQNMGFAAQNVPAFVYAPAPPEPAPPVGIIVVPPVAPLLPPAPVVLRTETVAVTQVGGIATVAPVVDVVSRAFADPAVPVASIVVPAGVVAENVHVEMPHALVTAAVNAPKPLRIEAPAFAALLPAEIFRLPVVLDAVGAGRPFTLDLVVNDVTVAAAPAVTAAVAVLPDAPAFSPPLQVFQIALTVDEIGRPARSIRDFGGAIVDFDTLYTVADLAVAAVADERMLNFYRFVDNTLQPQLTWVDSGANRATGWFHAFSRFVLMAYQRSFADIAGHWSQPHVELMASKHIIRGVDDVNFDPDRNITRAQFAALLQRAVGLREVGDAPVFRDVKPDAWYYGAVQAAAAAGLVKGYDGEFRPGAVISRQEMAVMLMRALTRLGVEVDLTDAQVDSILAVFTDGEAVSPWAREAVAIAVNRGIVKGRTAATFVPAANATRAESATMLQRTVENAGLLR